MTHPGASTNASPRLIRERKAVWLAAAVIGLEVIGLAAWWTYQRWRLGQIELLNNGAPLTVQVLDESGERPIGEPIDVIKKATLSLPDGDYRLRVTGIGRLGRTARFAVNRGETIAHELSLDEGRLLGHERLGPYPGAGPLPKEQPIPFASMTVALELTPGTADLIESSPYSLIRRDGATGRVIWDAFKAAKPPEAGRSPFTWLRELRGDPTLQALVTPAPDLNGDGTGDIVWAFTSLPSIFALSGADGSMLWTYHADPNGPGGPSPDGPEPPDPVKRVARRGRVLGAPVLADVDGDGTPDLIATMPRRPLESRVLRKLQARFGGGRMEKDAAGYLPRSRVTSSRTPAQAVPRQPPTRLAMPVAAAVPLTDFQALQTRMPSQIGTAPVSARVAFILGTLAGLPIVVYAGFAAWSLFRRRWKALAVLAVLTVAMSAVAGAAWLWLDRRSMPAIEHYDRSTWYLAAVPGAGAVGVLLLVGWPLRRFVRWIRSTRDRS